MISAIRAVVLGESESVVAADGMIPRIWAGPIICFFLGVGVGVLRSRLTGIVVKMDGMQASSNFKENGCLFYSDGGNRTKRERRKR